MSIIYVVQPGDTLSAISGQFGISVETIRYLNQLPDPNGLVVGQALLLLRHVKSGPLTARVNGFAYPYISSWVLNETLPFISVLSVFSYGFTEGGELLPPALEDTWMVERAKAYGVDAALVLTPLGSDGQFNNNLVHRLMEEPQAQERLLGRLEQIMIEKGYQELNIDFEYVLAEDRVAFAEFVALAKQTLPYPVTVCLAPKTSGDQPGLLYEGKDYRLLGQAADRVLLMTYEWGYKYGPPMAVAPLNKVRQVVEYALTEIPAEKIDLGMANYGYDWTLPFVRGETVARTIGNVEAVERARLVGAEIQFDRLGQSPYYTYIEDRTAHEVWFEDVRSWQGKLDLLEEYKLTGVGIWQVMRLSRAGMNLIGDELRHEGE